MKKIAAIAALIVGISGLSACGASTENNSAVARDKVTVTNCGKEVTFDNPQTFWANDANIVSIAIAAGDIDKIKWSTAKKDDQDIVNAKYGTEGKIPFVDEHYPSYEQLVAEKPDVYFAGWSYGLSESKNITPETLEAQGIQTYLLTESCRAEGGKTRGVVDPWEALDADLANIGRLMGTEDKAEKAVSDLHERRKKLEDAPQAGEKPSIFVFDSAKDTILTSGKFGGPQAVIEAAGGVNANVDVEDTWTNVGWEKLAASDPSTIVFVDYGQQKFEDKIAMLEANPATKDLKAVKEKRYVNLPYALWTSGPLNMDAAEHLRKQLEAFGQVPESDVSTSLDLPEGFKIGVE